MTLQIQSSRGALYLYKQVRQNNNLQLIRILLKMVTLITYWLLKTLLNTGSNITGNIVSITRTIAHKCPILDDLQELLDHKKTFP
jgi:hypothetical protein